jgi:hypothetical protein
VRIQNYNLLASVSDAIHGKNSPEGLRWRAYASWLSDCLQQRNVRQVTLQSWDYAGFFVHFNDMQEKAFAGRLNWGDEEMFWVELEPLDGGGAVLWVRERALTGGVLLKLCVQRCQVTERLDGDNDAHWVFDFAQDALVHPLPTQREPDPFFDKLWSRKSLPNHGRFSTHSQLRAKRMIEALKVLKISA